MKNPYKDKPWFKFLSNKYVWVLLFFDVDVFLDKLLFWSSLLDNQVSELEDKSTTSKKLKDEEQIKQLNNPEQIEKYAREKYYMKKDSEDIYIIEFEGDSIEKK
jgi:cell division protein FtsB